MLKTVIFPKAIAFLKRNLIYYEPIRVSGRDFSKREFQGNMALLETRKKGQEIEKSVTPESKNTKPSSQLPSWTHGQIDRRRTHTKQ